MAYNKNNYVRIKEEFSQKHRDKVNAADERKFLLESKYPELAEIDAALRLTAMKIYGALFVNEREKKKMKNIRLNRKAFLKNTDIVKIIFSRTTTARFAKTAERLALICVHA